jgi:thiol-disulfide isomerase/thioredoxin
VKRNLMIVGVLVVVITAMLVAGKYLARQQAGSDAGLSAGDVKGQVAPDFALKTLDGKTLRLSDLKGKAVLLNFWATWCSPCKIEMPWFVDLQKQYGPQGLQIVGVALQSELPDIKKFTQQIGVNYPIVIGNDDVGNRYGGIQGLPTTFYVGRDGKLVTRYFGLVSHREIEQSIQAALKQGEPVNQSRLQAGTVPR